MESNVEGYKACRDDIKTCDFKTKGAECVQTFQKCVADLDQAQLPAVSKCGAAMAECEKHTPRGKCMMANVKCKEEIGQAKCDIEHNGCMRRMGVKEKCESSFLECAKEHEGLAGCVTEKEVCLHTNEPVKCLRTAMECCPTQEQKDCLYSMVELKNMDRANQPQEVKDCQASAGVVGGNMEGTGDACKLVGCLNPLLKSKRAQAYVQCAVNANCGCKLGQSTEYYSNNNDNNNAYLEMGEDDFERSFTAEQAFSALFNM